MVWVLYSVFQKKKKTKNRGKGRVKIIIYIYTILFKITRYIMIKKEGINYKNIKTLVKKKKERIELSIMPISLKN